MPDQSDVRQIDPDGKAKPKRRFDDRDWSYLAEFGIDEYEKRKKNRRDLERQWEDIDRQVAMEPELKFKKMPNGQIDKNKAWMAEVELPLQAQCKEVLTADARRMMFPDVGSWFRAHAEMTDEYLREVDFTSLILGDEAEVPSQINQDNADKLVEGYLLHMFRQVDLATRLDRINAESFSYGMGVGRARMERKSVYIHEARGVRREEQQIPVLVPCSVKNLYLDDPMPSFHSAQQLGEMHIARDYIKLESLQLAAGRGSTEPDDEDGGWMPKNLKGVEPDDNGYVTVLELEGDVVIPRKTTRSMVIPGAVATIILGGKDKGGNATRGVVRFRFRKRPFSSYLLFPYHYEQATGAYPTSPLMKGRPIQIMATDAANRLLDSAALKVAPPVSYDRDDMTFAQEGGPQIYPGAQWETLGEVKAHTEIGGDPGTMSAMLSMAINLYAELTGVLPARLGAQTKSHTTAFAKDREIERGAVRTVDYVRSAGHGPLVRWLDMAYQMGRDTIKGDVSFFIDAYGGFVKVGKKQLPERAVFEWFGSSGPAEEAAKSQARLASMQLALQMDQLAVAFGQQPTVNVPAAIRETLREGRWTDLDAITRIETASTGNSAASALPGTTQGGPGPAVAALQALAPQ